MVTLKWTKAFFQQSEMTSKQQDWLTNGASLTERLVNLSNGHFSVELLQEGWSTVRPDEYQQLEGNPTESYWLREVFLKGRGRRWIYARTVAKSSSATHALCDLTRLGSKPLGNWVFKDSNFIRTPFSYSIYPRNLLAMSGLQSDPVARRSCFVGHTICLLVQEIFLSDFWIVVEKT